MDKFTFSCPECGNNLEADVQWALLSTTCPYCSKEITIPQPPPKAVPKVKAIVKNSVDMQTEQKQSGEEILQSTVPKQPMKKSVRIWIGVICSTIIGIFLLVFFIKFWNWYNNDYLPGKANEALARIITTVKTYDFRETKISVLKKAISDHPLANHTEAKKIIEIEERLLKKELWEKKKQDDFKNALAQQRAKSVFIIRRDRKIPGARFFIFRGNRSFAMKLGKFFQSKKTQFKLNQTMASLVRQYKGEEKISYNSTNIGYLIVQAQVAKRLQNLLKRQLVKEGTSLLLQYEKTSHKFNTAFVNIPAGEIIIVLGLLDNGRYVGNIMRKFDGVPCFLELDKNELKVATATYATADEQDLLKQKENQLLQEKKRRKEKFILDRVKTIRNELVSVGGQSAGTSPAPSPVDPEGSVESLLKGIVFFARLRDNTTAYGGKWRRKKIPFFHTAESIKTIRFFGKPDQGIRYQWKPITGNHPRSVSLWFHCGGYNHYDVGNSLFSYGKKQLGQYFNIETNKQGKLVCAWGLNPSGYADNVKNYQWNHFAVTYDGKRMTSYLNGKITSSYDIRLKTAPSSLMIGTRLHDEQHCFYGCIRNVAVYNRALSGKEVAILRKYGLKEDYRDEE